MKGAINDDDESNVNGDSNDDGNDDEVFVGGKGVA